MTHSGIPTFPTELERKRAFQMLDRLCAAGRGGAFLTGRAQSGKTHLIAQYFGRRSRNAVSHHPSTESLPARAGKWKCAVATMSPTTARSAGSLLREILRSNGHPNPPHLPLHGMLALVRKDLRSEGVTLLVIDESQHLWGHLARATPVQRHIFADVIKSLVQSVPTIFVGHENARSRPPLRIREWLQIGEMKLGRLTLANRPGANQHSHTPGRHPSGRGTDPMIIPRTKGELTSIFNAIWVKHPRADHAFSIFDELRAGKRLSGARKEAVGATLLAPSRSGKSRTVEHYIATRVVPDCIQRGLIPEGVPLDDAVAEQRLVVHITLTPPSSVGGLMTDLLIALGDDSPTKGTVRARRHRVYAHLKKHNTELLIIDEIQHLGRELLMSTPLRRDTASTVQNNIKTFLLDGLPVCFVGLPEARPIIFGDEQIGLRIEEEIDFSPLNYEEAADTTMVQEFCARLAGKLFREGVFDHIVDLVSGNLPECFCGAVNGRLGLVAELIRWATTIAFRERAATLTRVHLAKAVELHLSAIDGFQINPFADDDDGTPIAAGVRQEVELA